MQIIPPQSITSHALKTYARVEECLHAFLISSTQLHSFVSLSKREGIQLFVELKVSRSHPPQEAKLTLSSGVESPRPACHETPICRSVYRAHRASTEATAWIPALGPASACAWGSGNATHVTATALPLPLINPARVLAQGGHQMLGALRTPAGAPQRRVPLPHQALHHSSFSPFPKFKVPILTSFFIVR